LPDAAFAYAKDGVREYQVRGADGNPTSALVRTALQAAEKSIKAGGDPAEVARKAMPKIKASAKKLKMLEFKAAADKFMACNQVFKVGYSYEDELESDAPLDVETIKAYVAEHGDAAIVIFKSVPVTFAVAHARHLTWQDAMGVYDAVDILGRVLGNILLDTDLSPEDRTKLVQQSFAEFLSIIFSVADDARAAWDSIEAPTVMAAGATPTAGDEMTKESEDAILAELKALRTEIGAVAKKQEDAEKFSQAMTKRLETVEATPVIPAGVQLKVVEKDGSSGGRKADKPKTLPDLQKRYDEIKAELNQLAAGDARVDKLRLEGTLIAHEIECLKGQ
jgi:hypothetical protein